MDMTEKTAITARLAEHVLGIRCAELPAATVDAAKRLLLDGIGCMMIGTRGQPGQIVARANACLGTSGGPASVLVDGSRASARDAAFVNGISLYSVGVNDIHKPSGAHPGGCIIPALLAAGEWLQSPGEAMLCAMVGGYDVMGRLGRAMIPSHRERGFHPTGTFGAFGATAAVGRLMDLDHGRLCDAFGIAGSQAAGLKAFQTDGSLTMIFHAGRSAQNGVEAALLAREGFSGPRTVFEDRQGFVAATADEYRLPALVQDLGTLFEVEATSFRPFYGCTLTITASGSAAQIMRRVPPGPARRIGSIHVHCNPAVEEEVGDANPRTLLAARLSLPFNLGLVVRNGDVLVGDVDENDLWDPAIRDVMPLVSFESDQNMARYATEVTIRFHDGRTETAGMSSPKGDPENPMTWEETCHKFMQLVAPLKRPEQARRVADIVGGLDREGDGRMLMAAICAAVR